MSSSGCRKAVSRSQTPAAEPLEADALPQRGDLLLRLTAVRLGDLLAVLGILAWFLASRWSAPLYERLDAMGRVCSAAGSGWSDARSGDI
jgi:hypothetical protein